MAGTYLFHRERPSDSLKHYTGGDALVANRKSGCMICECNGDDSFAAGAHQSK